MHVPYEVPRLSVSGATLADADVDLVIIPIAQDHATAAAARYDGPVGEDLRSALERGEFRAKPNEIFVAADARVRLAGGTRGVRRRRAAQRDRRGAHSAHGDERGAGGAPSATAAHRLGRPRARRDRRLSADRNRRRSLRAREFRQRRPQEPGRAPVLHPGGRHFHGRQRRGRGQRRGDGRVDQRRARDDQRARQLPDAARPCRQGRRARVGAGHHGGDSRRAQDRGARHGLAARRRARQHRAAAHPGAQVLAGRRARHTDPGPRRQRHHVRYRRPVAEAGRRHGAHEGRHGRRRVGGRGPAIDRAAAAADPRDRGRADDREHAGRQGDQARRHSDAARPASPSK